MFLGNELLLCKLKSCANSQINCKWKAKTLSISLYPWKNFCGSADKLKPQHILSHPLLEVNTLIFSAVPSFWLNLLQFTICCFDVSSCSNFWSSGKVQTNLVWLIWWGCRFDFLKHANKAYQSQKESTKAQLKNVDL